MLIIILVKKKLKHRFPEVKVTAAGSGILGVMVYCVFSS
jgi:phosphatidylinositol-bisphosphatase